MNTRTKIQTLRLAMQEHHIDYYLVPSSDPHLSEYLPEYWQSRRFLSGFEGSVGTLVVSANFAGLWVDSRYWVQAEKELADSGIELMKIQTLASPGHLEWLETHVQHNQTLAADHDVLALSVGQRLKKHCDQVNAEFISLDILPAIWSDRSALPAEEIFEHTAHFVEVDRTQKIQQVREHMQATGASLHFISTLDDIAWILNLRGSDVNFNPVFLAHLLITQDEVHLFTHIETISANLSALLKSQSIQLHPYLESKKFLASISADETVLIDPKRVTLGLIHSFTQAPRFIESINPSTLLKSQKTASEAEHIRQAMIDDGVALVEFFTWLDHALANNEPVTELLIADKLLEKRQERPNFISPSFATIAGFNGNGAQPHYRATKASFSTIEKDGLLLIDSGGQYLGGTTDITRMVAVGELNAQQKKDASLVLKGVIQLSSTHFPNKTLSPMLDALARAPMWAEGCDFGHGTGHGVGYFLNVHEGPQSISRAIPDASMAMLEGMITSIEPALYRPEQWGIRFENLVLNVKSHQTSFAEFLAFETLTLCPIDVRCLDVDLLTMAEKAWLNQYHSTVYDKLSPLVSESAKVWLQNKTCAI